MRPLCECCEAPLPVPALVPEGAKPAAARRRKLWDLHPRHHCLLLGAAFDPRELRQMFRRVGSSNWREATDYELHSSAVHFAQSRNDFSELAHKRIEERFRAGVQALRGALCPGELVRQWKSWTARGESVEAYWAALTHPACDPEAEENLACGIHMVAHDLFAERRAAARRVCALELQVELLRSECTGAQQRTAALRREAAAVRDEAIAARRDAAAASAECGRLRSGTALGEYRSRLDAAAAELGAAKEEIEDLRRALRKSERAQERSAERPAAPSAAEPRPRAEAAAPETLAPPPADLSRARILCVGGKRNLVPLYRAAVETARGEFVHHDGGIEDQVSRLPALLGGADAVVCLAGDCSHPAYYAVKRYCKRFGKPCALLGNSSVHALTQCITKGFARAA